MEWIIANLGTIIVLLVLAVAVAAVIRYMIKERKNKTGSCDGNCSCCSRSCH